MERGRDRAAAGVPARRIDLRSPVPLPARSSGLKLPLFQLSTFKFQISNFPCPYTVAVTLLSPWSALTAAAIAIPLLVLLYFLKLRRQRLTIASTLLSQKSFEDLQVN